MTDQQQIEQQIEMDEKELTWITNEILIREQKLKTLRKAQKELIGRLSINKSITKIRNDKGENQ